MGLCLRGRGDELGPGTRVLGKLGGLALGGDSQFRDLSLCGGAQCVHLALGACALLGHLGIDGRRHALGLAGGLCQNLSGLALRGLAGG